MSPICATCAVTMKCTKNDFIVADEEFEGAPATYRNGDLFSCPKCGCKVVISFGMKYYGEHTPDLVYKVI